MSTHGYMWMFIRYRGEGSEDTTIQSITLSIECLHPIRLLACLFDGMNFRFTFLYTYAKFIASIISPLRFLRVEEVCNSVAKNLGYYALKDIHQTPHNKKSATLD